MVTYLSTNFKTEKNAKKNGLSVVVWVWVWV